MIPQHRIPFRTKPGNNATTMHVVPNWLRTSICKRKRFSPGLIQAMDNRFVLVLLSSLPINCVTRYWPNRRLYLSGLNTKNLADCFNRLSKVPSINPRQQFKTIMKDTAGVTNATSGIFSIFE
ncbi:Uncharacterised protein [Vibrio cholerae]|nr:Uncharacterised protein [Vibrio cholerae]